MNHHGPPPPPAGGGGNPFGGGGGNPMRVPTAFDALYHHNLNHYPPAFVPRPHGLSPYFAFAANPCYDFGQHQPLQQQQQQQPPPPLPPPPPQQQPQQLTLHHSRHSPPEPDSDPASPASAAAAGFNKAYTKKDLGSALDALRLKRMTLTRASEVYGIPPTTLWQRANKMGISTPKHEKAVKKAWTEDDLNCALAALRKKEISANKAAKRYGIPSSTLYKIAKKEQIGLSQPFNAVPTTWTKEDLTQALAAIRGGMPVQKASTEFGIPSGTLYGRCKRVGIELSKPAVIHWSEDDMVKALESVRAGGMSINQAALAHNLPYSSLYGRINRLKKEQPAVWGGFNADLEAFTAAQQAPPPPSRNSDHEFSPYERQQDNNHRNNHPPPPPPHHLPTTSSSSSSQFQSSLPLAHLLQRNVTGPPPPGFPPGHLLALQHPGMQLQLQQQQ